MPQGNAKAPAMTGKVWMTFDFLQEAEEGYLVTAGGDLDNPIAYIDAAGSSEKYARDDAELIAANPAILDGPKSRFRSEHVIDLRKCGGESSSPMPGWVYGLKCVPIDDLNAPLRNPCPLDWRMLNHMAGKARPALAMLIWSPGDQFEPGVTYEMVRSEEKNQPLRSCETAAAEVV